MIFIQRCLLLLASVACIGVNSGCVAYTVTSAVVGTATAVAVEVVEVPFEVASGIHDAISDDEDGDND